MRKTLCLHEVIARKGQLLGLSLSFDEQGDGERLVSKDERPNIPQKYSSAEAYESSLVQL